MKRSLLFAGLIALLVGCQAEDIPAIRLSDAALTFKGAENSPVVSRFIPRLQNHGRPRQRPRG